MLCGCVRGCVLLLFCCSRSGAADVSFDLDSMGPSKRSKGLLSPRAACRRPGKSKGKPHRLRGLIAREGVTTTRAVMREMRDGHASRFSSLSPSLPSSIFIAFWVSVASSYPILICLSSSNTHPSNSIHPHPLARSGLRGVAPPRRRRCCIHSFIHPSLILVLLKRQRVSAFAHDAATQHNELRGALHHHPLCAHEPRRPGPQS